MDKDKVQDAMFEALLRQVIIDKYHSEVESIPSSEDLRKNISFTPEFEVRMTKLFSYERRKGLRKSIFSYTRKIASVFIIVISLLFGMLLFNPEVRAATSKAIIEWYEKFTSIIFINQSYEVEEKDWYPSYIPNGYIESFKENLNKLIYIEFKNDVNEKIRFSYSPVSAKSNLSIDNENHKIQEIKLDGSEAYTATALTKELENGVIWIKDGYKMDIWSKLSIEEIIKIAESMTVR